MNWLKPLVIFSALTLAGCGDKTPTASQTETAASPPPAAKTRVALVMKTLTNPFFIEMERGARRAESDQGIELSVKTAAQETSFEQQAAIVDDIIQNKLADALVIAPADAYHLIPSISKARAAGIPVVNIDARLDKAQIAGAGLAAVPFISVDNEMGGYLSAKALLDGVAKPTQVAILEGIRTAENAEARKNGALRAFAENKQVKVVASETANWKIDEAYDVTKAMFAKHPGISRIFAANDMMALGAIKYLTDAGKAGQVKVAGFDNLEEVRAYLGQGILVATIDQQAAEQGYQGIQYALRLLKGETLPAETLLNVKLVTSAKP